MPIDPLTGAWIGAQIAAQVAQALQPNPHTGLLAERPGETDHLPRMTPEEHALYMEHYFNTHPEHRPAAPPGFSSPIFTDEELEQILKHDMHANPDYATEMAALVTNAQNRTPGAVKPSRLYDDQQLVPSNPDRLFHNPQFNRNYSMGDSGTHYQEHQNPQTGRNYTLGTEGLKYMKKGGSVMTENGKLLAPWETDKEPTMLVVHMTTGELEGLDAMQGGESIDPDTGLREYSKLATIVENPEVRDIFKNLADDLSDGELSPQMRSLYEEAKQHSAHFTEDTPAEHTQPIKDIEKTGTPPDRHMAIIPENLALFFVELSRTVDLNPETGLLQFGIFHELVRVGGTVAGYYLGGPFGAGVGNMAARAATGQKFGKDMLMAGAKNTAYAYGAQALGQMAGLGTPGGAWGYGKEGTFLGNMANKGFGPENYGAYGSFFGKAPAAAGAAAPAVNMAKTAPTAAAGTAAGTAASAAAPAAAAGAGWTDKLMNIAPWAALALSMHGQKQHHQDQTKAWEHGNRERERAREDAGFNIKPRKVKPAVYKKNPAFTVGPRGEMPEPMYFREDDVPEYRQGGKVPGSSHAHLGSYNQGALIKGPGKGQDDKIRTRVPEGSYIIDASTVANLGDGSSEAGGKILKECEGHIRKKFGYSVAPSKSKGMVDVFLSNDEYKFDPETVSLLGKGDNRQGSKILKTMVKNIRIDKNRNGNRLPPKAKHPLQYMKLNTSSHHRGAL